MQIGSNTSSGGAGSTTNGGSGVIDSSTTGDGNGDLSAAFDRAITEARATLVTTTIKGADLRALQQRVG